MRLQTTLFSTLVGMVLLLLPSFITQAQTIAPVRFGVLAFADPVATVERWQPTADYLAAQLQRPIQLLPLTPDALAQAVVQQQVDFIIGNALTSVAFKKQYGTSHILTLVNRSSSQPEHSVGSAIVTRNDTHIAHYKTLTQLKIVSSDANAFGGFQIFAGEMAKHGINAYSQLPELTFVGFPQDKLLHKVLNQQADVAILPTCVLETAIARGEIAPSQLKVALVKPQHYIDCQSSSALYPSTALSKLGTTDHQLATKITQALLQLTPDSLAATQGRYRYWSVPVNDSQVFQLLEKLKQWPFVTNWWLVFSNLLPGLLCGIFILFLGYLHHLRVKSLVKQKTKALVDEIQQHKQTQQTLLEQQKQFFRAQRVLLTGEMASGIAHELKQPLAGIRYLTQGCIFRLKNTDSESLTSELEQALTKVIAQVDRAQHTINHLRDFCQQHSHYQDCDLATIIDDAISLMQPEFNRRQLQPQLYYQSAPIYADASLIQQVIVNLIRNALDAMTDVTQPQLTIKLNCQQQQVYCQIQDNGCGLTALQLQRLFIPFETTKADGLGLGMVICKRIIEEHRGHIDATSLNQGLSINFSLPLRSLADAPHLSD